MTHSAAPLLNVIVYKKYNFFFCRYETSDGQTREEVGYFRDDEKLGKILTVRGSYS